MSTFNRELQEIAQNEVGNAVEVSVQSLKQRFGHLDEACLSAVVLLLCAKTLETAGYEIARSSNPSPKTSLFMSSADIERQAYALWEDCRSSRPGAVARVHG